MTRPGGPGAKVPPYSIVAEKLLLGGMLRTPGLVDEVYELIEGPEVFFRPEHGSLYQALGEAGGRGRGEGLDALIRRIEDTGKLERIGGARVIRDLERDAPDRAGALQQAHLVAEKGRMRALIDTASDILHDAYHSDDTAEAIIRKAKRRLTQLGKKRASNGATKKR